MARARTLISIATACIAAPGAAGYKVQGTVRDYTAAYFSGSTTVSTTGTRTGTKNFLFENSGNADWFVTPASEPFNEVPHSVEFSTSGSVLQYQSNAFYPIDGLLYGNEGTSHNSYYTFQLDTIVTTTAAVDLTFGASCSMWVGTCTGTACTTELEWEAAASSTASMTTQTFTLGGGSTYRLWVAYAHHCAATPQIQIQIPDVALAKRGCDASTAPIVRQGMYPLSGSNLNRKNILSTSDTSITLLSSSQTDTATSVWHPNKLDLRRGFMASFSFATSAVTGPNGAPSYSGFAFVVQNDNSQAQGDAGEKHFDGIANGLAVEVKWTAATTVLINIEHRFSGASAYTNIASSSCSTASGSDAYIAFIPENTNQIQIYFAGCTLSAALDSASVSSMWSTLAYVGFTGGVSGSDSLTLTLTEWKMRTLQASGAFTSIASSGIVWAQYGQHKSQGVPAATSTSFTRVTDVVTSTYVSNHNLTVPTSTSFAAYDPFPSSDPSKALEIVYFRDETPVYVSIPASAADLTTEALNARVSQSSFVTGTSKPVVASNALPSNPSYLIVPVDGCGNPTFSSAGTGLASAARVWSGTLHAVDNSTTMSCSSGLISIKYASYCGVDVTSAVQTACDGKASCAPPAGQTCSASASAWEQVFSGAFECYDAVAPSVSRVSGSTIGVDSTTFGFYQEVYGVYLQHRTAQSISTDVRFNGDSIGAFSVTVQHTDVDETKTTFDSVGSSFVAGQPFVLLIRAKDAYGNNVTTSSISFAVSFDQISNVFTSTHVGGNVFNVTVRLTAAITGMNMYVRVDSKDIQGSPVGSVSVTHATPTTAFINAQTEMVAAESGGISATLTLQDAFGNTVTSGGIDVRAVIVGVHAYGSTPFTANSFTGSNVVISSIYHNVAGAYTIEYYMNGTKLTSSTSLTINPSTASVQHFTLKNSSAAYSVGGGDANFFTVQTRDPFGNARTTASGDFDVQFVRSAGGSQTHACPSATCTYETQGAYKVIFTPLASGEWKVKAYNHSTGNTTAITFTVNAGVLDAKSLVTVTTTSTTADSDATFTVLARDAQSNVRDHVDTDGASFVVTLDHLNSTNFASVIAVSTGVNGLYTFTWRAAFTGCAGWYQIKVQLSDNTEIEYSGIRVVLINPAATAKINDLTGAGTQGGEGGGNPAFFFFKAYDAFDNLQLSSVNDVFWAWSDESAAAPAVAAHGRPNYIVNYTLPAHNAASPQFTVRIWLNTSSPAVLVKVINPTVIQGDSDVTGASASGLGLTLNPDVPESFRINNLDGSAATLQTQRTFFVDFVTSGAPTTVVNNLIPSCTTGTAGTAASESCNVTVNSAATKHLTAAGNYILKIRVGTNNYSPKNYSVSVVTGNANTQQSSTSLSAATVAAGTAVTLSATIKDAYGNQDTTGSRTVTFEVTGNTVQCRTVCTLAATWQGGSNTYTVSFTPYNTTTYSIIAKEGILELGTHQSLVVTHAAASSTHSRVVGISKAAGLSVYMVGFPITVTLELKDLFGNPIASGSSSFVPTLTNNIIPFSTAETGTTGTYLVTCTPNVSSTYASSGAATNLDFAVSVGGSHVTNSPQSIEVEPGNIDGSLSSATTPPSTVVAGEYFNVNLTLKDAFGNPWKQQVNLVRLSVRTPDTVYTSQTFGATSTFREPVLTGSGEYRYQIRVTEGNIRFSYTLEYISSTFNNYTSVTIPVLSSANTDVIAGPAVAAKTVMTKTTSTSAIDGQAGTSPFAANFLSFTNFTLHDAYGNTRFANASGDGNVTVRVDGHLVNDYVATSMPAAFICTNGMDYTANVPSFEVTSNFSISHRCTALNDECSVTMRGPRAGNFRMLVFVNGQGAYCYQFTTQPAAVDAAGSSVTHAGTVNAADTGCDAATGEQLRSQTVGSNNCLVVQLADAFGNFLTGNVSTEVTVSAPSSNGICAGAVSNSSTFVVGRSRYLGNGKYMIYFTSRLIGTANVTATIGGLQVGSNAEAACTELIFTHYYPYKFVPTVDPLSAVVNVESTIAVSAADIFGNNVTSGNFYYSLSLSAFGRAYALSVPKSTALVGLHTLTFTPQWPGIYRAVVTLTDLDFDGAAFVRAAATTGSAQQEGYTLYVNVTVSAQTCAASGQGSYRCGDDPTTDQCVSSYADCPGVTVCTGSTPLFCEALSRCVANVTVCNCTTPGATRCLDGTCVANATQCVENSLVCPTGTINCATLQGGAFAQCVASAADCPAPIVCPPGNVICDDGFTCARNSSFCFDSAVATNCSDAKPYKCFDGRCVADPFDCPAHKSCGAGKVLCSDGSCQADTTTCPSQYACTGNKKRCPDGSCATDAGNCPSMIACPKGLVLCENNRCAATQSACQSAIACALTDVRCPDGSCAGSAANCPTRPSCSDAEPVLCDDGACVATVADCQVPSELNDCASSFGLATGQIFTCPNGACASNLSACPTGVSCPDARPVRCADGSCQINATLCAAHTRATCPKTMPVTCPDGSCRASARQCPSEIQCPDTAPVKCEDRSCVAASSYCSTVSTLMDCPPGQVRCSHGCAPDAASCPSVVTCPIVNNVLYQRCVDGTCRDNCSTVTYVGCSNEQVTCPSPVAGFPSCAARLADCPTGYRCPDDSPVLCLDGTCATDTALCPAWPTTFSKQPCAGGGWQLKASTCGTPVTCPNHAPYKCQDESCRRRPEDCPQKNNQCPEARPYRCHTGDCLASVEECPSSSQCSNPTTYPVKCAAVNSTVSVSDGTSLRCVASAWMCDAAEQTKTHDKTFLHDCPNRWAHCRDTTCVDESSTLCEAVSCPEYMPYLCDSGLCAVNVSSCPATNGCPFDRPHKCTGGSCTSRAEQCPTNATACDASQIRCNDGSCAAQGGCPKANGCAAGHIRCLDGSCVAYDATATNPGTNFCVSGEVNDEFNNACPYFQPVRCAGGLCAASVSLCPVVTHNATATNRCPQVEVLQGGIYVIKRHAVLCADGSCVDAGVQCPTLHACSLGHARCGDGSCRSDSGSCPKDNTCPSERPYRCTNGVCATGLERCVSPTSATGCPCASTTAWDTNGYCTNEMVKCVSTVLGGLCTASGVCSALESGYARANGCNSTHAIKCWNGACVAAEAECLMTNGCPAASPARCTDGTCQADASACASRSPAAGAIECADNSMYVSGTAGAVSTCSSYTGCGIATPYRCADGTCAKYRAFSPSPSLTAEIKTQLRTDVVSNACDAVLVCPDEAPVRCADYTCAAEADACPPTHACPDASLPYVCKDLRCAVDASSCSASNDSCPLHAPVLCPDGSCRQDVKHCVSERVRPSCAVGEVLCFDGGCRRSAQECVSFAYLVENPTQASFSPTDVDADSGVCADSGSTKMTVCSDGSCVPAVMSSQLCAPTERCPPALPLRCPNSTCVAATGSCAATPTCTNGRVWCPDGTCRTKCLPSNGCSGDSPFFCPLQYTSSSFCVADNAACQALTASVSSRGARPLDVTFDASSAPQFLTTTAANTPPTCTTDCNRDVEATTQTFTLDSAADATLDIAVSTLDNTVRGALFVPAGALDNGGSSSLQIESVGDSELRSAINYVHKSRQVDYSGVTSNIFSMEQTVLSAAFKCVASTDPFNLNVQYQASVDNHELINAGTALKKDICLAVINPASDSWVCFDQYLSDREDSPITNISDTRFVGKGFAYFGTCKDATSDQQLVFAFAHIPIQSSTSSGSRNLLYLVQIIVVLSVVGGATLVLVVAWFTTRAARYRRKMKEVQAKTEIIDNKIQDMKIYGGGLGEAGKDEDIDMMANPMVVKFKSLQDQLREYKETTGYYLSEAKKQNEKIDQLEKQRTQLNDAVKKLRLQLEEQRHRIAAQKRLREQQAETSAAIAVEVEVAAAAAGPDQGDDGSESDPASDSGDDVIDVGRDDV